MNNPQAPLLTYKQTAEFLQVSERTVFTLVQEDQLQAVRFGRTVRIDQDDLNAFVERAKGKLEKRGGSS